MHIPDGYLSPSTCVVLYAGAAPFWYSALRKLRTSLGSRTVPRISLVAAFCFIVMMFNLPLPGGTTGHVVGVAVAVAVVGPWGAVVAISLALAIQALFFGDGGITTLGANCLNLAVVAPLTAHVVYRLIASDSTATSRRRFWAAGAAGYVAINASALMAGIELGLQPALFVDASGAPLYAPYTLGVALPAIAIGHLTLAGLAELFVSAGAVAWLARTDQSLLWIAERRHATPVFTRRPWLALGALMVLTPLGLLAGGVAWGEWDAEDFSNPQARQEMTDASFGHAPPATAPAGLSRLASVWSAPIPGYAPAFLRSPALGYLLSALFGAGLIVLVSHPMVRAARALRSRAQPESPS